MVLVDSHAHLNFDKFGDDFAEVLKRAKDADVNYILNVGTDYATTEASVKMAQEHDCIFAAAGIHPTDASGIDIDEAMCRMRQWLKEEKVVAIGEVGLDYYHDDATPEEQKSLFSAFIDLQKETGLPIIIHVRDAYDDLFQMLETAYPEGGLNGVVHCFSGNEEHLKRALDLGLHISITGPVTYKKSDELRRIAALIPDERLLLETDCPFLAPQKYRGKRNEPAFVRDIGEYIAELRGISLEDIARITTFNCSRLFGFPEVDERIRFAYMIRGVVYINTTASCTNKCYFCVKYEGIPVKGYNLDLKEDPGVDETLAQIFEYDSKDIVFCGLGEPLLRLDYVKAVASSVKEKGYRVRINTNGQANMIHKRNILPELEGLIDSLSISLNAEDAETYDLVCRPSFDNAFEGVIEFIKEAKKYVPDIKVTYVDVPEVDEDKIRALADSLGVTLRVRHYNVVG